jgi:hypothetical protein
VGSTLLWRAFDKFGLTGSYEPHGCNFRVARHSESDFYSFSWIELSALLRWRTRCGDAGHKLVSHAEQVPQDIGSDASKTNQNGCVVDVVVRQVINVGGRSEQLGAVLETDANDERTWFGGPMSGYARQKFSADLEGRGPIRGALLDAGQSKSDLPYGVEVDCASGHSVSAIP